MFCILGLAFFMGGLAVLIIALVNKGIPLGGNRYIPTVSACILGAVLMMPLCCGQGGEMLYGGYVGFQEGFTRAQANQGKPLSQQEMLAMQESIKAKILPHMLLINVIVLVLTAILAAILLFTTSKARQPANGTVPPNAGLRPDRPDAY